MQRFTLGGLLILSLAFVVSVQAQTPAAGLFDLFKRKSTTSSTPLSETRLAEGLKEALRVGTDHAVARTGKTDGYFANPLIKILLPEKLQGLEKGLRLAGYGAQVDAFILSMNRAAEAAAPQAKAIFLDAIVSMTIEDAKRLLHGGDTAATDFFKAKTSQSLYEAFRPVVDRTLNQVGTVQTYNAMMAQVRRIPFVKTESLEVGDYVTHKALGGLFVVLGEEERRIRQNPAARVTAILKDVFGQQ
jgi:hypothetical protein